MTVTPEVAAGRDLLVAALAHIETHPEEWDQALWWNLKCGTAGCLAGHMAASDESVVGTTFVRSLYHGDDLLVHEFIRADGRLQDPIQYVAERVGVGYAGADDLTWHENSLDDLRVGVKAVLNDEPVGPAIERARAERP